MMNFNIRLKTSFFDENTKCSRFYWIFFLQISLAFLLYSCCLRRRSSGIWSSFYNYVNCHWAVRSLKLYFWFVNLDYIVNMASTTKKPKGKLLFWIGNPKGFWIRTELSMCLSSENSMSPSTEFSVGPSSEFSVGPSSEFLMGPSSDNSIRLKTRWVHRLKTRWTALNSFVPKGNDEINCSRLHDEINCWQNLIEIIHRQNFIKIND